MTAMETVTNSRISYREALRQIDEGLASRRKVAGLLGIGRVTLWRWLKDGTLRRLAEEEGARLDEAPQEDQ